MARTQYPTVVLDDFEAGSEVVRVYDDHSDLMITHRQGAQDSRLRWKDRGVLWYLLSKPKDWQVRLEDLIAASPGGREEVQGILSSLQKLGYLQRFRVKNRTGEFVGWMSKVSARPVFADPAAETLLDMPAEAPQQPQEARNGATAKKEEHPDLTPLLKAYCGTKEKNYKDGWLGYKPTDFMASRTHAKQMLEEDYSPETIKACYFWLKEYNTYYRINHLNLGGVHKHIGEFAKREKARVQAEEHFMPDGLELEFS
jgi:hypothetical protein